MNWNVVAQLALIVNRDDGRMLHISLVRAAAQAEKYAKWWQRSRATHEDCPCDVIGSTIAATG